MKLTKNINIALIHRKKNVGTKSFFLKNQLDNVYSQYYSKISYSLTNTNTTGNGLIFSCFQQKKTANIIIIML